MPDTPANPSPLGGRPTNKAVLLTSDRLLGARLYLHTWIRLIGAFSLAIGAVFAVYIVQIERLNLVGLLSIAVVIAGYNAPVWFFARLRRQPLPDEASCVLLRRLMIGTILLDYLALTATVWMIGGPRSPFIVFFLFHLIVSCVLLPRRDAIKCAVLAYVFVALLVINEWTGLFPAHAPGGAVEGSGLLDARYAITILAVHALLFGLVVYLLTSLSTLLRHGERELRDAVDELNRLSDVRRDFLNIAVHDVRAPTSGVVMILNNFLNGLMGPLPDNQVEWLTRARKRLDGLSDLLGDLQTLAMLETTDIESHCSDIDTRAMLETVAEEYTDAAADRGHTLSLDLTQNLTSVRGIERLLREAVVNYVTNAIKYTPKGGHITIGARPRPLGLRIYVTDNGIGIAPENQSRLFHEFVRIKVAGTAVSNAKGTGLGLSIVRHVIEEHGGHVGVTSTPGRGSTFYIDLPAASPAPLDAHYPNPPSIHVSMTTPPGTAASACAIPTR